MDEADPVPEVDGKKWSWKLFKRKPREPYIEFDEWGQPEIGPVTGGVLNYGLIGGLRAARGATDLSGGHPTSPYARELADAEAALRLASDELKALDHLPTHGGPQLTEAGRAMLRTLGMVDTTHISASASAWNAMSASNYGTHHRPFLHLEDLPVVPPRPFMPPEPPVPGKIYR